MAGILFSTTKSLKRGRCVWGKKPINGGINSENRIFALSAMDKGLSCPNLFDLDGSWGSQHVEFLWSSILDRPNS